MNKFIHISILVCNVNNINNDNFIVIILISINLKKNSFNFYLIINI